MIEHYSTPASVPRLWPRSSPSHFSRSTFIPSSFVGVMVLKSPRGFHLGAHLSGALDIRPFRVVMNLRVGSGRSVDGTRRCFTCTRSCLLSLNCVPARGFVRVPADRYALTTLCGKIWASAFCLVPRGCIFRRFGVCRGLFGNVRVVSL